MTDDQARPAAAAAPTAPAGCELVTLGETMALVSPPAGASLRHAGELTLSVGGAESNVAIAARRLGVDCAWIGRVGADELGERVLREIRGEGVRVMAVVDPDARTGLMVKDRRSAVRTRVWYYRAGSAGSRLEAGDVDAAAVVGARILHLTGITPALSASAHAAVRHAAGLARQAGAVISIDLNYRRALWPPERFAATLRELVASADIVFGSLDEVAHLLGADPAAGPDTLATELAELGPDRCVVKLGERGAVASVEGTLYRQPAFPVPVVDTVGAGDAFVAGWLSGQLRDPDDVPALLRIANACGAFACTAPGDWESAPTQADLDDFLAEGDQVSR